jgi:peptide deformylase
MALIYYPNPIFKQKATIVTEFDDTLFKNISILQQAMKDHRAIGIGANMCGILQRIIIVPNGDDAAEGDTITMINPQITEKSAELQTCLEASLSFPGIEAQITRPEKITISYQDTEQQTHIMNASGFLATVIQHEIDYLDGIVFLEHLPKAKAQLLREKMQKYMKKINRHGAEQHNHSHGHGHNHEQGHHHYHDGKLCTHKH